MPAWSPEPVSAPSVSTSSTEPAVSIIVPTYNRADLLPLSLESIRAQTWRDWELIVIDDGGRDNSAAVVDQFAAGVSQSVHYLWRENGGPALARNSGLDLASGKYVAFLDSDDSWLPHHLKDGVAAMEANPDVDWIYCAGRRVEYRSKRVLIEHTMYGTPEPPRYLKLRTRQSGRLRIFDDPTLLECALRSGGLAGLQSSVVRREVFSRLRFQPAAFFEDRIAFMRAVAMGVRFAYLDDVHVIVYSHDANISFASDKEMDSRIASMRIYMAALEALEQEFALNRREIRALRAKRGDESFWNTGYSLAERGRYRDALGWMRYGLRCRPANLCYWKTYLAKSLNALFARGRFPGSQASTQK
jgi:glycosyltransferase involved in cell wall biosynthesis